MRLGKHLSLGFLLSLVALGLYYALAVHVIGTNRLTAFDQAVTEALYEEARTSRSSVNALNIVTTLGDGVVLTALSLSVALVLIWWRHRLLALVWLIAAVGGQVLNIVLKSAIERQRPPFAGTLTPAYGYSFPSGHAMASLVIYGMLAYLLVLGLPIRWLRVVLVAALGLLVLAIGFSRVYLSAHWPSDVLGGFCAGTVWLVCCITAIETVRRRKQRMQAANQSQAE